MPRIRLSTAAFILAVTTPFVTLLGAYAPLVINGKPVIVGGASIQAFVPAAVAPVITPASAQFIANGGAFSFTPTLSAGDSPVTWTASGLPGWASVNSSTGAITGTASTGATTVKVTATNSAGADSEWVRIVCHSSTANISSGDTFPLSIATANRKYTLTSDITADATALVVGATNVSIDLNGHTITYDNAAQPTVNNTGFETQGASSTLAANWDNSAGTHILRAARTWVGLYGSYSMHAAGYVGSEYILSDAITLPAAAQQYQAWCFCKGDDSATVTIAIVDASSPSTVLASAVSDSADRGFAARVLWNRGGSDPTSVKLKITVTLASGDVCDVDFAGIRRSGCVGVWASHEATSDDPNQLTGPFSSTIYSAFNVTLADTVGGGGVVQANRSYASHAVQGYSTEIAVTGDLTLSTNGMDCASLHAKYCGAHSLLQYTTCIGDSEAVQRRLNAMAQINFDHADDHPTVRCNTIQGSGWSCINMAHNPSPGSQMDDALIEENFVDDWYSLGTDGYGIVVHAVKNSTIRRNKIVCLNGRGIIVDDYGNAECQNLTIGAADYTDESAINAWWGDPASPADPSTSAAGDGNFISIRERANNEFPRTGMEATALRIRYYDNQHTGVKINGNYFYADTDAAPDASVGTDKWVWAAFGARLTTTNSATVANGYQIHNNTFKAIVLTKDAALTGTQPSTAVALCLTSYTGADTHLESDIADNVLESNNVCLLLGDNDGYGYTIGPQTLYDTSVIKSSDGDATMTFQSYRVGDWAMVASGLTMVSTTYSGGATEAIAWGGPDGNLPVTGQVVDFANRITTHVTTSAPADISGATVTILNNQSTTVFSGSTGSDGLTAAADCSRITYTHNGTTPSSVNHNPFDISAAKSGYTTNSDLDYSLSSDATRTIILSP